jgi:PAS domain S-box-containing protein
MGLSSAFALLLLFGIAARTDYNASLNQGWQSAERASQSMADYTARALEVSRQVTERAGDRIESHGLDYFRGENWSELPKLADAAPMIGSVWIYDRDGNLIVDSLRQERPRTTASDRDFYPALKNGGVDYIMGLTLGRISNRRFFSYNRAVRAGDELVAIVQASIYENSFAKFLESLGLGPKARFRIFKHDGTVVLRWPDAIADPGKSDIDMSPLEGGPSQEGGGYFEESKDGVTYLCAYQSIPSFDLAVIASVPRDAVLEPYWRRFMRNLGLLAAAYFLIAAFAAASYRNARRNEMEAKIREEAEQGLRKSEARYRSLVEQSADGIFVADSCGQFVDAGPAGCAMLGMTRDEILTLSLADIVEPDEVRRIGSEVARFAGGKTVLSEWRFRRKDGSVFVGEVLGRQLADGRLQTFVRDITERRKAEKQLRESEERFRATFENAAVGVAQVAPGGAWLLVNKRLSEITGYSEEELLTKRVQDVTHPEDIEASGAEIRRTLRGETDSFCVEKRYIRKDDSITWVRLTVGCVRRANGRIEYFIGVIEDISEQKRVEHELRLTTARFQLALKGSPVMIFGQDLNLRYTWMYNPASGYDVLSIIGKRDRDFFECEEDAAVTEAIKMDVIQNRVSRRHEVVVHRHGVKRFYDLLVDPLLDGEGNAAGVTCAAIEITERKEAEAEIRDSKEQLRESEERLSAALRAGKLGVYDYDPRSRRIEWDKTVYDLWGIPEGEPVTYETFEAGLHPDDVQRVREEIGRSFELGGSGSFECEMRVVTPEGAVRWVFCDGVTAFDQDGPVRLVGTAQDITARKHAKDALRESEERFRGIFKHAGTGIAIADLHRRFQSCNPAFSSMLGYTEQELLGLFFPDLVHPEDRETNTGQMGRLLSGAIPSFEIMNRYVGKDGRIIWVHKHMSLARNAAGEPTHIIALVTDMTDRKRHEEQVSLLLREVNHRSKNMLTLVQAVARQTVASNPGDFLGRFGERIHALAASQDLLVKNEWRGVDLEDLVRSQLAHFKDLIGRRIELAGPELLISAQAAQSIGMAIHELATNAGKYGALSSTGGRVAVKWGIDHAAHGETFAMSWHEEGGPPVGVPSRQGFGSTVLRALAERSLDAKVCLDFAPEGLCWRLECRTAEIIEGRGITIHRAA